MGLEAAFSWSDPLRMELALSEDEQLIKDAARDYCQNELLPRVLLAHRNESFDREIKATGFVACRA